MTKIMNEEVAGHDMELSTYKWLLEKFKIYT